MARSASKRQKALSSWSTSTETSLTSPARPHFHFAAAAAPSTSLSATELTAKSASRVQNWPSRKQKARHSSLEESSAGARPPTCPRLRHIEVLVTSSGGRKWIHRTGNWE